MWWEEFRAMGLRGGWQGRIGWITEIFPGTSKDKRRSQGSGQSWQFRSWKPLDGIPFSEMGSLSGAQWREGRMVVYRLDMLCWVCVTGRCPGGVDQLIGKQARKEGRGRFTMETWTTPPGLFRDTPSPG